MVLFQVLSRTKCDDDDDDPNWLIFLGMGWNREEVVSLARRWINGINSRETRLSSHRKLVVLVGSSFSPFLPNSQVLNGFDRFPHLWIAKPQDFMIYPLVMTNIAMENHHV